MPYPQHVKDIAYKLDPECWKSYSGKRPEFKRDIDFRRNRALERAMQLVCMRSQACSKVSFALLDETMAHHRTKTSLAASRSIALNRLSDLTALQRTVERLEDTIEELRNVHLQTLQKVAAEHKMRCEVADAFDEVKNLDTPAAKKWLADTAIQALRT